MANDPGRGVIITATDEQWDEAVRRTGSRNPKALLRILMQQLIERAGLQLFDYAPNNLQPRGLPRLSVPPQPLSSGATDIWPQQPDQEDLNTKIKALLKPSKAAVPKPAAEALRHIPVCYMRDEDLEENFNHAFAECKPYVKEFYEKTRVIRHQLHEVENIVYKFSSPGFGMPRSDTEKNFLGRIYSAYRMWWQATYGTNGGKSA